MRTGVGGTNCGSVDKQTIGSRRAAVLAALGENCRLIPSWSSGCSVPHKTQITSPARSRRGPNICWSPTAPCWSRPSAASARHGRSRHYRKRLIPDALCDDRCKLSPSPSWPGLTRPSTRCRWCADGRVKPGHDGKENQSSGAWYKILISNFGNGLALSIFAWIIAAAAVQNLLGFKFDFAERGYAQRTRKRWLWVSVSFVSFLVLAAFDIVILSRASFSISKLL